MCPMLLSRLSDGPALVLPSPQDHVFLQFPSYQQQHRLDAASGGLHSNGSSSSSLANGIHHRSYPSSSPSSWKHASSSVPIVANPAKKRSRRDAGIDEADMSATQMPAAFGQMVENAATTAAPVSPSFNTSFASDVPSRKSQRFDTSVSGLNGISHASIRQPHQQGINADNNCLASINRLGSLSPQEPLVDDATRLLGISWQRIENNNDMAAAVRGWKKYIDNQYSKYLQDSQILMKNRALNVYLVAARPVASLTPPSSSLSFYLFSEDLTQAQLVASTWETCLQNLKSVPIVFEGAQVLRPSDKALNQPISKNANILASNAMENTVPLLQSFSAQPVCCSGNAGLNGGVEMGTGMDIDL